MTDHPKGLTLAEAALPPSMAPEVRELKLPHWAQLKLALLRIALLASPGAKSAPEGMVLVPRRISENVRYAAVGSLREANIPCYPKHLDDAWEHIVAALSAAPSVPDAGGQS